MDATNLMHLVHEISHNILNSILGGNVIFIFTDWILYNTRLFQISTRAQIILSFICFTQLLHPNSWISPPLGHERVLPNCFPNRHLSFTLYFYATY
jgi:hypothetical protein